MVAATPTGLILTPWSVFQVVASWARVLWKTCVWVEVASPTLTDQSEILLMRHELLVDPVVAAQLWSVLLLLMLLLLFAAAVVTATTAAAVHASTAAAVFIVVKWWQPWHGYYAFPGKVHSSVPGELVTIGRGWVFSTHPWHWIFTCKG